MNKIRLFLGFMLAIAYCTGQNESWSKKYFADQPYHAFVFKSDGTFFETTWPRTSYIRTSYGTYTEKRKYIKLQSSPEIMFSNSLFVESEVFCSHLSEDSLSIKIESPYEKLLMDINRPGIGWPSDFPLEDIHRIYCYNIQITCADDSVNCAFEQAFNSTNWQICTPTVIVYKPKEVIIRKIAVTIFWNPDVKDNYLEHRYPYCETEVTMNNLDCNAYVINIPRFDYLFLSYARYNGYRIKKIRGDRILFEKRKFDRHIFH